MARSRWFVIELNDAIDNPSYSEIENAILDVFGESAEYFIPIHYQKVGSYVSTSTLIQGYVFVKESESTRESIASVCENRFFNKVIMRGGRPETIDSAEIAGLRRRLKSSLRKRFVIGSKVRVMEGALKNLIGEIISVENGGLSVMVRINRRSREILAPIPSTLVEEVVNE